jgi:hypothetical protein
MAVGTALAGWDGVASHAVIHAGPGLLILVVAAAVTRWAQLLVRRRRPAGMAVALALVGVGGGQLIEAIGAFGYWNDGAHRFGALVFTHNILAGLVLAAGLLGLPVSLAWLAVVSDVSRPLRWAVAALAGMVGLSVMIVFLGLNPFSG